MVCITVAQAIARLRAVRAPFAIDDSGITTMQQNSAGQFVRRRIMPWQDSLGSLVSRDAVNAEAIYWQNRNQDNV